MDGINTTREEEENKKHMTKHSDTLIHTLSLDYRWLQHTAPAQIKLFNRITGNSFQNIWDTYNIDSASILIELVSYLSERKCFEPKTNLVIQGRRQVKIKESISNKINP